jgi:DNA-binding NtrC family response regulator
MKPLVLVVDSQLTAFPCWKRVLGAIPCELLEATATANLSQWLNSPRPRAILLSFCGHQDAIRTALQVHNLDQCLPLILVVAQGSEELAVAAFRAGVTDYFHMPGDESALREALLRLLFPSSGAYPIAAAPQHQEKSFFFVGSIATIAELNTQVTRIAASNSNVLITGETGTGKELVASAIHQLSARSHKPFISLNCAAIPDALAESEFFGHERGAFTGAYLRNQGSLEAAHQGTVFLDEVGDMSAGTQAKLLRVIENKEFRRLGGKTPIKVDVRFIAATNRNLEEMAGAGRFREDLYYRLNIARVHLLPLRERKEDIPILIRHYVQEFGASHNNRLTETDEVWECLLNYDWPGNVRELKNALESAFVNSAGGRISISDLPCEFRKRCSQLTSTCPSERQALLSALLQTKWNKSRAAEQLRWSRMTLYRKMRKYRIPPCSDHRIA